MACRSVTVGFGWYSVASVPPSSHPRCSHNSVKDFRCLPVKLLPLCLDLSSEDVIIRVPRQSVKPLSSHSPMSQKTVMCLGSPMASYALVLGCSLSMFSRLCSILGSWLFWPLPVGSCAPQVGFQVVPAVCVRRSSVGRCAMDFWFTL